MSVLNLLSAAVKTTTLTYKLIVTSLLITQVVGAVRKNRKNKSEHKSKNTSS
jgi:hypothetical protein